MTRLNGCLFYRRRLFERYLCRDEDRAVEFPYGVPWHHQKIVMLSLVALCHGLDITSVIPFVSVRDAAVFAFCLNDFGSILENIERMGYGSIIPAPIRKMLKAMEERSEAMASDVVSGGEIHRQHRDE